MTQADQTANSTDARQASMSRVSTQETILAKLNTQEPAKEATEVQKTDGEQDKDGEQKPKKGPAERIQELIAKRKEAEEKLSEAERRAADAEARAQAALAAKPAPIEDDARPKRSQFTDDESYEDAIAKWGGRQAVKEREVQVAKAQAEARQAEIAAQWSKRQEAVMKALPDYAEVLGKTEVQVPEYIHEALMESEQGPQVAYYMALHPDEAKRIVAMRPVQAIKRLTALERDLAEIETQDKPAEATPKVQKPKAPPPIEPVKSSPSGSSSQTDYETYKARRKAEQRK